MEFSSFFNNPRVTTVGTSYYHSSLHYLGYSPYASADPGMGGDVKPNLLWVSEINVVVFLLSFFSTDDLHTQPRQPIFDSTALS